MTDIRLAAAAVCDTQGMVDRMSSNKGALNAGMMVDIDLVRRLAEVLDAARLTKIDVSNGNRRIQITREPRAFAGEAVDTAGGSGHCLPQAVKELDIIADTIPECQMLTIRSLHVGTIHLADRIGGEPFAPIGRTVKAGDTLLLVEVLKVKIPILASSPGVVAGVLVDDGGPVEFDQPLISLGV